MTFSLKIIKNHEVSPYIFQEDLVLFLPVNFQLSSIYLYLIFLSTYHPYEYYYPHFAQKGSTTCLGSDSHQETEADFDPRFISKANALFFAHTATHFFEPPFFSFLGANNADLWGQLYRLTIQCEST